MRIILLIALSLLTDQVQAQDLEEHIYASDISETDSAIKTTKDDIKTLDKDIDKMKSEIETLKTKKSKFDKRLTELNKEMGEYNSANEQYITKIDAEERAINDHKAEIERRKRGFGKVRGELDEAFEKKRQQFEKLDDRADDVEKKAKEARRRMERAKSELEKSENAIEKIARDILEDKEDVKKMNDTKTTIAAENVTLRTDIKSLEARYKVVEKGRAEQEKHWATVKGVNDKLNDIYEAKASEVSKRERHLQAIKDNIQDAKDATEKLMIERDDLIKKGVRAENDQPILKAQIEVLLQRYQRLAERNKSLKRRQPATAVK